MKMSDFGSAISCMGIREGVLGITAEVIWRSEAAVKPSGLEFVLNAGTSGSQIVSNLFQEAQDLLLKKRGG